MPDELTEEDERLSAKANVVSVKTSFLKKGLARQKNLLAAKKEVVNQNMQPPEYMTAFLNDEATLGEIEKIKDKQDILMIVYHCIIFACRSRWHCPCCCHCPCYLQIPHVLSRVHKFPERGCRHEHDSI